MLSVYGIGFKVRAGEGMQKKMQGTMPLGTI